MLKKIVAVAILSCSTTLVASHYGSSSREVPLPFPVEASLTTRHYSPDIACAGVECLVVWMAFDDTARDAYEIRGLRVSSSGRAIGSSFSITKLPWRNTSRPQVVSVGSGYIVFYGSAMYAEIKRDGAIVSKDLTTSMSNSLASITEVEAAGGSILVYWLENRGPLVPYLTLYDGRMKELRDVKVDGYPRDIAGAGNGFVVASSAVEGVKVTRLAADGTAVNATVIPMQAQSAVLAATADSVLVAWRRIQTNEMAPGILFTTISGSGVQPVRVLDEFSGYAGASSLDVVATSTSFLVTWTRPSSGYYSDNVYAQRVSGAGQLIDARPLNTSPNPHLQMTVKGAAFEGGYLVAWADWRYGMGHDHVFAAVVPLAGSFGADFLVSRRGSSQSNAVMAMAGSVVGIAWNESGAVRFARASTDGRILDPTPLLLSESGGAPAIAWSDNRFIIAWREGVPRIAIVEADGRVKTSRIDFAATGEVSIAAGLNAVALLWTIEDTIMAARVDFSGRLVESPRPIGQGKEPKIGFDGHDYWVVARALGSKAIEARRNVDAIPFPVSNGTGERDQLALACGNRTCVALWREGGAKVHGALLTGGGVVPGILTEDATQPAITWNGTAYLLSWSAGSDIHAAEMSAAGNLEHAPRHVTESEDDEQDPAVAAVGASRVFAFRRADRVYLRIESDTSRRRTIR